MRMAGHTACGVAASITISRTLSATEQSLSDPGVPAVLRRGSGRNRQIERDRRPLVWRAVDRHKTPGVEHDAVHERETQSSTLANLFGGEERLEQVGLHVRGHADAVVADAETCVLPGWHRRVRGRRRGDRFAADVDMNGAAIR